MLRDESLVVGSAVAGCSRPYFFSLNQSEMGAPTKFMQYLRSLRLLGVAFLFLCSTFYHKFEENTNHYLGEVGRIEASDCLDLLLSLFVYAYEVLNIPTY